MHVRCEWGRKGPEFSEWENATLPTNFSTCHATSLSSFAFSILIIILLYSTRHTLQITQKLKSKYFDYMNSNLEVYINHLRLISFLHEIKRNILERDKERVRGIEEKLLGFQKNWDSKKKKWASWSITICSLSSSAS